MSYDTARMSQTIGIIVDDREVRSGVLEVLSAIDDISMDVQRLPLGDYEVDGRLLEAFGSVEAALTASTQDLIGVPGIGSTTAEAIRWAVREATLGYGFSDNANDPIL